MPYYVELNGGRIVKFGEISYTGDILSEFLQRTHGVLISDEQKKVLDRGGQWDLIDGILEQSESEITLAEAKEKATREIDRLAESARLRFVTQAVQSAVYQLKREEATRFLNAYDEFTYMNASLSDWPFLSVEIGITGETLYDVAIVIHNTANRWITVAASIEGIRLTAKKCVNEAISVLDIIPPSSINWPVP